MSDFVPQIPDWFNTRKAAQVTAFFALNAGGSINILRATKLIYLADRESLAAREHTITGDNFVSMKFGPVNSYTYSYMRGQAPVRQEQWAEFIGPRCGHELPLVQKLEVNALDELCRGDLKILNVTWEKFSDIERFELAEWTHKFCPEWKNPGNSSVPIDLSTIFKRLEKQEPVELAEAIQAERSLISQLSQQ